LPELTSALLATKVEVVFLPSESAVCNTVTAVKLIATHRSITTSRGIIFVAFEAGTEFTMVLGCLL
jgi:hypothetical protein